MEKFILQCSRPVAIDSIDHTSPNGTMLDNNRNLLFNRRFENLLVARPLDILDFGCAGGGFIKSCIDGGHRAVGLEGSDYSKQRNRAEWATIPDNLFTCDIVADFRISKSNGEESTPTEARFDVITAWEFMEHIHTRDLPAVCRNAEAHLKKMAFGL